MTLVRVVTRSVLARAAAASRSTAGPSTMANSFGSSASVALSSSRFATTRGRSVTGEQLCVGGKTLDNDRHVRSPEHVCGGDAGAGLHSTESSVSSAKASSPFFAP